jgi:AraC-like DNA-binding protein
VQTFDYRGARVDSTEGKIIVLYPDERHNGRAGAEGGFAYRMLYVEPRLIRAALAGEESKARVRSLPFLKNALSSDPRLVRAVRLALSDLDHAVEELDADRIVLELAEALAALDAGMGAPRPSPACAVAVERARQLLDAAQHPVASAELEAATGLDRYTLARHFRTLLGTSPYRYLVMRRLDRARALMRQGLSLAEAAHEAGFADQSHMTRQFRDAYGVSPGRWRAMAQGAA